MCVAGGAGLAAIAVPLATTAMQGVLNINSSLAKTKALQEQQDAQYKQMVEGIRGRNIAKRGKTLRDQDLYKQVAGEASNTATRAYFKTDIELDQEISKANLATQTNLVNLIEGSGKGSAAGGLGGTADRINMQAIKNWGRKDAAIRHGVREKALGAEYNKEAAQSSAGDAIKIAGRKYLTSSMGEPIPEGPEPIDWKPGVGEAVAQTGLDLFSVISQPSPFNFPGDSGFDASKAFSGDSNVLGGLGFDQNIDLGLGSNQFLSKLGASPFTSTPWSSSPY